MESRPARNLIYSPFSTLSNLFATMMRAYIPIDGSVAVRYSVLQRVAVVLSKIHQRAQLHGKHLIKTARRGFSYVCAKKMICIHEANRPADAEWLPLCVVSVRRKVHTCAPSPSATFPQSADIYCLMHRHACCALMFFSSSPPLTCLNRPQIFPHQNLLLRPTSRVMSTSLFVKDKQPASSSVRSPKPSLPTDPPASLRHSPPSRCGQGGCKSQIAREFPSMDWT